jgi:hypothetical protein
LPMLAKNGGAFLLFRSLFTQHAVDSNDTVIGCLWNVFMVPPPRFYIPRTAGSFLSVPYQVKRKRKSRNAPPFLANMGKCSRTMIIFSNMFANMFAKKCSPF